MSTKLRIIFFILTISISINAKSFHNVEFVPNEFIIKLSPETKIISPNSLSTGIIEIDRVLLKISVDISFYLENWLLSFFFEIDFFSCSSFSFF